MGRTCNVSLRHSPARASTRAAREPRSAQRPSRAPSQRQRDSCRSPYSTAQILRFRDWQTTSVEGGRGRVRAARPHVLAAEGASNRREPDRLPVRIGRNERRRPDALRRQLTRGFDCSGAIRAARPQRGFAGGRRAKAAAIDHAGIYLGGASMLNSSRYGVALAPVTGWYADRFAWGRRLLAEARLG